MPLRRHHPRRLQGLLLQPPYQRACAARQWPDPAGRRRDHQDDEQSGLRDPAQSAHVSLRAQRGQDRLQQASAMMRPSPSKPMKRLILAAAALSTCAASLNAYAAEKLAVTVQHDLSIARPSETISIPWSEVNALLPGALIQRIAVKDGKGRVLPYQVTNVAPLAKDPQNVGIAYGELLFQHSVAPGEKSASFTVEKIDTVA